MPNDVTAAIVRVAWKKMGPPLPPEDDHLERDERLCAGEDRDGHDEGEDGEKPLHVPSEGSKDRDAILVVETPTFKRG